ncbi:MAG TPA: DEAD/DEAH box helicase [Chthoniobacteraceae bacterium]|nr:DEAD/DEAH box helicase [Chthoniobacteraceae bacterium]
MATALHFKPPSATTLTPRPYQEEALDALDEHLATKETNPCVVVPTAGGKSFIMALAISRWKLAHPPLRVCILAHRKELVKQNSDELIGIWPAGDIGIYAAGLRRRNVYHSILYASIDSIWNKWGDFEPFDVIFVDEAQRIPARGEGKYRAFINGCKQFNPHLRVIGITATPYRMEGPICHRDHILQEIAYEVHITQLLQGGYVCPLRSRIGEVQPDISGVQRNGKGDYIEKQLAEAVDKSDVVAGAVSEMVRIIRAERRQSVIVFCVDIAHCENVSRELRKYGIAAPYVTAKTPVAERDRLAEMFKRRQLQVLLNVNVYTEGFNAKCVDCVVLLRPTLSKGLYVQMVGRGLRLHPDKSDCLVLDFAGCIAEHGPIDQLDAGVVIMARCGGCGDSFSRAIRVCPHCGWEIPPVEMERLESEEKAEAERRMHAAKPKDDPVISEPIWLDVDDVSVHLHRKVDAPDSLRVQYRCGITVVSEWICLNHSGFARKKAGQWWLARKLPGDYQTVTVAEAVSNLFLGGEIKARTKQIQVIRRGRYHEILDYQLS